MPPAASHRWQAASPCSSHPASLSWSHTLTWVPGQEQRLASAHSHNKVKPSEITLWCRWCWSPCCLQIHMFNIRYKEPKNNRKATHKNPKQGEKTKKHKPQTPTKPNKPNPTCYQNVFLCFNRKEEKNKPNNKQPKTNFSGFVLLSQSGRAERIFCFWM